MARPLVVADYKKAIKTEIRDTWKHILLAVKNIRKYRLLMKRVRLAEKLDKLESPNVVKKYCRQHSKSMLEKTTTNYETV